MTRPHAPAKEAGAGVPSPARRPTILAVDDTPEFLAALGEILAPHYRVLVANSGERALALLAAAQPPDLILLDIEMPGMDGYAVLAEIKRDARTREIPVVFATARDAAEDEQLGLELGAADYLAKPFNAKVALARIRTQLALREAHESLARQNALLLAKGQELRRSLESLEKFSYTVSHDLRAPLRAIHGYVGFVLEDECERLSPEGRDNLRRIAENAERMDILIRDILAYSRAERATATRSRVDMNGLVGDVARELRAAYPEAEVVVADLPPALADATMLRQVVANLLDNALKFSSKSARPRVEVTAAPSAAGVEYHVRDNGAGFDPRYADRLFGVFQRLHGQAEFPGTGVGLAIVKRLLEHHGGAIVAESSPGHGATFRFTLPPPPASA